MHTVCQLKGSRRSKPWVDRESDMQMTIGYFGHVESNGYQTMVASYWTSVVSMYFLSCVLSSCLLSKGSLVLLWHFLILLPYSKRLKPCKQWLFINTAGRKITIFSLLLKIFKSRWAFIHERHAFKRVMKKKIPPTLGWRGESNQANMYPPITYLII